LSFTTKNFEDFGVCLCSNFRDRHVPLSGFLFAFLLDHIRQNLGARLDSTIQKISWKCSIFNLLSLFLDLLLFMGLDLTLHLDLLIATLLLEQLSLDTAKFSGHLCSFLRSASFLLALSFFIIQSSSVQLTVTFHILILRHVLMNFLLQRKLTDALYLRHFMIQ